MLNAKSRGFKKKSGGLVLLLEFIAYSNLFISLCAASMNLYAQQIFLKSIQWPLFLLTFCATFLLYNTQRLFLSVFSKSHQNTNWYLQHRSILLFLMALACFGLYPLFTLRFSALSIYAVALILSIFYFLPGFNFRKVPLLKTLLVGIAWSLVCVLAPVGYHVQFALAQTCLICALCILFNIRDTEHDRKQHTQTLPVLIGIAGAQIITYLFLGCYLILSGFTNTSLLTFALACYFTMQAHPNQHPFYYFYGVDGIIILEAVFFHIAIL